MIEHTAVSIERIARASAVADACAWIRDTDRETLDDMRALAGIAGPPHAESARAAWLAQRFTELRLDEVVGDDVGNVIGTRAGTSVDAAPLVVAAHLDTIFPAGTVLDVREAAGRLLAPGIGDNARGVVAMLAIARAFRHARVRLDRPVLFVGTVGEEGTGDLRGVKHLFRAGSVLRGAGAFLAIDGAGARRIVARAVGSRRFRITFDGPGGHSWSDRGTPNAAHALGSAIARLARLRAPAEPAWTVSVGRLGGGTSVNAIPASVWLELDVRAESAELLDRLTEQVESIVHEAARETGAHSARGGTIDARLERIGDRPAASMPTDAPLLRIARAATRYIGEQPELVASSTDANVPMALGIPSIAIGGGGESGGTHTLGEWYDNTNGAAGIVRALLIVVAIAGLA